MLGDLRHAGTDRYGGGDVHRQRQRIATDRAGGIRQRVSTRPRSPPWRRAWAKASAVWKPMLRAAPVTMMTSPSTLMLDLDRLDLQIFLEPLDAHLAADAALLVAAEW